MGVPPVNDRLFQNVVVLLVCLGIDITSGWALGFLTPWPLPIFFVFLLSAQAIGLLRDVDPPSRRGPFDEP